MGEWRDHSRHSHGWSPTYVGQWCNGARTGEGAEYDDLTGDLLYEGFHQDARHGLGQAMQAGSRRVLYDGPWHRACPTPRHSPEDAHFFHLTRDDGEEARVAYAGGVRMGVRHGQGSSYTYEGACDYRGEWEGDEPHGQGTEYLLADVPLYVGAWRRGQRHGVGTSFWPVPDHAVKYHGEWADGRREGRGSECRADGEVLYEGEWRKGARHGEGALLGRRGRGGAAAHVGGWAGGCFAGRGTVFRPDGRVEQETRPLEPAEGVAFRVGAGASAPQASARSDARTAGRVRRGVARGAARRARDGLLARRRHARVRGRLCARRARGPRRALRRGRRGARGGPLPRRRLRRGRHGAAGAELLADVPRRRGGRRRHLRLLPRRAGGRARVRAVRPPRRVRVVRGDGAAAVAPHVPDVQGARRRAPAHLRLGAPCSMPPTQLMLKKEPTDQMLKKEPTEAMLKKEPNARRPAKERALSAESVAKALAKL